MQSTPQPLADGATLAELLGVEQGRQSPKLPEDIYFFDYEHAPELQRVIEEYGSGFGRVRGLTPEAP